MKIDILKLTNCQIFLYFIHFLHDIFVRVTFFFKFVLAAYLFIYVANQQGVKSGIPKSKPNIKL